MALWKAAPEEVRLEAPGKRDFSNGPEQFGPDACPDFTDDSRGFGTQSQWMKSTIEL